MHEKGNNQDQSRDSELSRDTVEHINETRSWFFERINKINKPLPNVIQKKKERTQINKIMNERGKTTINTKEMETITRNY